MRALSFLSTGARHAAGVAAQAMLVAAIIAAIALLLSPLYQPASWIAGTAGVAAGKPGVIAVPDGVYGGTTTATVNPGGTNTWVFAECRQNGVPVYREYVRTDANNQAVLHLGPTPSWTGGSAECTAQEGYWFKGSRWRVVAETDFFVAG